MNKRIRKKLLRGRPPRSWRSRARRRRYIYAPPSASVETLHLMVTARRARDQEDARLATLVADAVLRSELAVFWSSTATAQP